MIFLDVKGIIDNEQVKVFMEMFNGESYIFSVETVRRVLDENPNEDSITLNIDCDGGSVEEGLKIYDLLRMSGKTIYTNIVGGCHSMAVIVLLAAPSENRTANRNVRALIHRVYTGVCEMLSADTCIDIAESLVMEEQAILDIYVDRTGTDRARLEEVMREERVHDANSLLELNFISRINSYNTNQLYKSFNMAEPKKSAYQNFMDKLKKYRAENNATPVNYDYTTADGEVVFTTPTEEDVLTVGDTVTITSGETSATFILGDGREVVIEDNIVITITQLENETDRERIERLEGLLDDATNAINELRAENLALTEENKNYKSSNYKPRPTVNPVPAIKGKTNGADNRAKADIKTAAREKMAKVDERLNIRK